jgi:Domain of unknown function (DUF397)
MSMGSDVMDKMDGRVTSPFRKSRWSGERNCAEVGAWRTSLASSCAHCAEVGQAVRRVVVVRDTKQAHLGRKRTVLAFEPEAWRRFIAEVKEEALP